MQKIKIRKIASISFFGALIIIVTGSLYLADQAKKQQHFAESQVITADQKDEDQKLASGIILAHNHPSGNLSPSDADLKITKKIKDASALLDLSLLDHLIVSSQGYLSLADDNLMP